MPDQEPFHPQGSIFDQGMVVSGAYWRECSSCHIISPFKLCSCQATTDVASPRLIEAYTAARQARFEQQEKKSPQTSLLASNGEHRRGKVQDPEIFDEEKTRTIFVSDYEKMCVHCKQAIAPGNYYILAQAPDSRSQKHHCMNCCAFSYVAIKDTGHRAAFHRATVPMRPEYTTIQSSSLLSKQANALIHQLRDLGRFIQHKDGRVVLMATKSGLAHCGQLPDDLRATFQECKDELTKYASKHSPPFVGKNMPGAHDPTVDRVEEAKILLARLKELGISIVCRKRKILLRGDVPMSIWDQISECRTALMNIVPPEFQAGDHVSHKMFGLGTVLISEMEGGTEYTQVQFKDKTVRLVLDYTYLEKVSSQSTLESSPQPCGEAPLPTEPHLPITVEQVKESWNLVRKHVQTRKSGAKLDGLLGAFTAVRVEGTADLPVIVIKAGADFFCSVLQQNKSSRESVEWALEMTLAQKCKVCVIGPQP